MPNKFILDTCTVSHFLEGINPVVERIISLPRARTYITAITISEAYYGILAAPKIKQEEAEDLKTAINAFQALSISPTVAYRHADLKAKIGATGCKQNNDLWMLAFCEEEGATLITTDAKLEHLKKFTCSLEIININN